MSRPAAPFSGSSPLLSLQVLRALAALAVAIGHVAELETRFLPDTLLPAVVIFGFSGVDLFFVISGFVMVYVTRGTGRASPAQTGGFLYARIARIYPPYWLFSAAALAGYLLWPASVSRGAADLPLLSSLVLWPSWEPPILLVGWTLIHEMYFYLVFALFLLVPRRFLPVLLLTWIGGVVLGTAGGLGTHHPALAIVFHPLTAEFALGAGVGLLVCSGRRRFGALALALAGVWLIGAMVVIAPQSATDIPTGWMRVLAFAPTAVLLVYGLACLEIDAGLKLPRGLVALGDWSYALYLGHLLVLSAWIRLWGHYAPDLGLLDNAAMTITALGGCIVTAWLTYRFFEQPVLRLSRRFGDRLFPTRMTSAEARLSARIW